LGGLGGESPPSNFFLKKEALSQKFISAYRKAKEEYPDKLVFLAQGIFYRTLDEDAKVASEICGLKLMSEGEFCSPIPVCGFPQSGLDKYVGKLVRAGKLVVLIHSDGSVEKVPVEHAA